MSKSLSTVPGSYLINDPGDQPAGLTIDLQNLDPQTNPLVKGLLDQLPNRFWKNKNVLIFGLLIIPR